MKLWPLTYAFLLMLGNSQANAESFDIDPVHTRVAFMVSHAGFSNPIGSFSNPSGKLTFDDKEWKNSSISVSIPLSSLNLGDVGWQEKMLDGTFFNAKKFPTGIFTSEHIEKLAGNTGIAYGTLSLRGVTQPITVNFTLNAVKRHPLSFRKTIGISATTTISRKSFGMGAWSSLIGDEVNIIIELEATQGKAEAAREQEDGNTK